MGPTRLPAPVNGATSRPTPSLIAGLPDWTTPHNAVSIPDQRRNSTSILAPATKVASRASANTNSGESPPCRMEPHPKSRRNLPFGQRPPIGPAVSHCAPKAGTPWSPPNQLILLRFMVFAGGIISASRGRLIFSVPPQRFAARDGTAPVCLGTGIETAAPCPLRGTLEIRHALPLWCWPGTDWGVAKW